MKQNKLIYQPCSGENIEVLLPYSKSILNRCQIISFLAKKELEISDRFVSYDNRILDEQLRLIRNNFDKGCNINVQDSGTALRFLISLLCITPGQWTIDGSARLRKRPIHPLVEALRVMGGKIEYLETEDLLPLRIYSSILNKKMIDLPSDISSQFISSLMLISPFIEDGLELIIRDDQVSLPYLRMTFDLMKMMGAEMDWLNNNIIIQRSDYNYKNIDIERDWSAASYWYLLASILPGKLFILKDLFLNSLQGDCILKDLFCNFGVSSKIAGNDIIIENNGLVADKIDIDLRDYPDIAPSLIVASAALDIPSFYTGLKHLKFKESDRLKVLETELCKLGFNVETDGKIFIVKKKTSSLVKTIIHTNNDHRIAMSLIPLAILIPGIRIDSKDCVHKSYPSFFPDIEKAGIYIA